MMKDRESQGLFANKKAADLYDIICNKNYYAPKPFTDEDLNPDLIVRWRVPKQKYIKRQHFHHISAFANLPQQQLEQAFAVAQKTIISEMQKANENHDTSQIRFRQQNSFVGSQQKIKATHLHHENGQVEQLQFNCFDQKLKLLDGFTLYFNSLVYILQKHCGFRVRAFMLHKTEKQIGGYLGDITDFVGVTQILKGLGLGSEEHVRDIYLFLSLNLENMMNVANKYKIKKLIDPTTFDFSLNDPSASDNRPIKLNSCFKFDKDYVTDLKRISRYFKSYQTIENNAEIKEEASISLSEKQNFKSFWEQTTLLLNFFNQNISDEASNQQKIYLYDLNRGKLNLGCSKIYSRIKKRRQYYIMLKQVCEKYGYIYYDQPECYGEFMLASKHTKGGFFQRLSLMLNYTPVYTTFYGEMALFSSMERAKLCYLTLKQTFKVSYLSQLGWDIYTFNNDFQKTGKGGENQRIKGGLQGTFVTDRWNIYALFTDIRLIRSYFGETLAYEIMLKGKIIIYLLTMAVPYTFFYILEQLYPLGITPIVTSLFETGLFATSFAIFTLFIQQEEEKFKIEFEDNYQEKVFLKNFRGPYMRNPLTDQLNQFQQQTGILSMLKSLFCIVILSILIVIFGSIFYGCRVLLIQLYEPLYNVRFSILSASALLSYSVYFLIGDVFKLKFYGFIIKVMIRIKNPHDEESSNKLRSYFTFYYLLSLQFIPIVFFYFIEPLSGNSCYQDCYNQYLNYVYARFSFNLAIALFKLITVVFFSAAIRQLQKIEKALISNNNEKQGNSFQDKLKRLLVQTVKQSEKSVYEQELTKDILSLFSYSFYCTGYPLAGIITFLNACTIYVTTRFSLLYVNRRPVNKSNPIIPFSSYCGPIYFFGLLANCWVNAFLLNYIERYYTFLFKWSPKPLSQQSVYMIKLIVTLFFMIIFTVLGIIARYIAQAFSVQTLFNRQRHKYKQYMKNVRRPKTKQSKLKEMQPLKVICRTFNPENMNHQLLKKMMQNLKTEVNVDSGQFILSAKTKKKQKKQKKQIYKNGRASEVRLVHNEVYI